MRKSALVLLMLSLAVPVLAADNDKSVKCLGGTFHVNDKTVCVVEPSSDDWARRTDEPQKNPASVSLVTIPDEPHGPYIKLSGHLMAVRMMQTTLDPSAYRHIDNRDPVVLGTSWIDYSNVNGWGLSAQWSPDDKVWVEFGWQRPANFDATFDIDTHSNVHLNNCWGACDRQIGTHQVNQHIFTADDFSLVVKWDLAHSSKHVAFLVGVGVHYRVLRDNSTITTTDYNPWYPGKTSTVNGHVAANEWRTLGQADLELYPCGRDKLVGFGVSARILSGGTREKQFTTDTLLDQNVVIGIQPGWYDVTARLIIRF